LKRRINAALSGAAFFYALGIVGAVEHGAPLARMLWTIPLLAIAALFAFRAQKCGKENRK
jgi:hypothetical protein